MCWYFSILLFLFSIALSFTPPSYKKYSVTGFIPFENFDFSHTPSMLVQIDGKESFVSVDTGSALFAYSATSLPSWKESNESSYPRGYEFLSSSKVLWTGYFVPYDVYFPQADATSNIPLLVVTQKVVCPDWTPEDGVNCPSGGRELVRYPRNIQYMGVGFGREYNGMPDGTPEKNALLNVYKIGLRMANGCNMRKGYVVTKRGVHVGLTEENTARFRVTKLQLVSNNQTDLLPCVKNRDWSQPDACLSINHHEPCDAGKILADTGIPHCYITLNPSMPVNSTKITNPSINATVNALVNGTRVTATAGSGMYEFTLGNDMQAPSACVVTISKSDIKFPFLNTGRNFFKTEDVMYDGALEEDNGGWYGWRKARV